MSTGAAEAERSVDWGPLSWWLAAILAGVLAATLLRPSIAVPTTDYDEIVLTAIDHALVATGGLLTIALVALLRRPATQVRPFFKLTHLLPSVLQTTLLAYWFLHWPPGRALIVPLVVTLALAFALDAAFATMAHGAWRPSFGPVPIVLSTVLFAQYFGSSTWLGFAAVAVAIASKYFLRRGEGHIFNPSALGLSVVALVEFASSTLDAPDHTAAFSTAPLMAELVLALAIVVQLRLPIVLMTLSATLTLWLVSLVPASTHVNPIWPPVLVVLALLVTDPATTPREPLARVLFGVLIALGMQLAQPLLFAAGETDFWSKVAIVPFANFLAPHLDRWTKGLGPRWLGAEHNRAHVAVWLVLAVGALILGTPKVGNLEHAGADSLSSPCYVPAPPGERCAANPLFCQPYRVDLEVRCWMGH